MNAKCDTSREQAAMKRYSTERSPQTGGWSQRSLLESARMRRIEIVLERDAWIQAAPRRAFEVSVHGASWRIALTERGRVVATGEGENWEDALAVALGRRPRDPST